MARVNVYLPDDLAAEAKRLDLPISALTQSAITTEINRMSLLDETPSLKRFTDHVRTLIVETDGYDTEFEGAWIIEPDSMLTRSTEDDADAGTYWGLAVTGHGRFAVYSRHVNDRWPATLEDFDTLEEALDEMPYDLADEARAEVTGRMVRDI